MADFIFGRQQILDKKLDIHAYEILFRGQDFDLKQEAGATQATNQVITDSILELGLNQIVGPHKAFINEEALTQLPLTDDMTSAILIRQGTGWRSIAMCH